MGMWQKKLHLPLKSLHVGISGMYMTEILTK